MYKNTSYRVGQRTEALKVFPQQSFARAANKSLVALHFPETQKIAQKCFSCWR